MLLRVDIAQLCAWNCTIISYTV